MSLFEVITKDEFDQASATIPPVVEDAGVGTVAAADSLMAISTYPCTFCGHCETPDDCAWAHVCPKCAAPAGPISQATYCRNTIGTLVGLHAERWKG
jgi:hypothetical protein